MAKDRASNRKGRRQNRRPNEAEALLPDVPHLSRGSLKPVRILTDSQKAYDSSISGNIITFGVGPAGTGKTWLAATRAADAIRDGETEKIIITRPAIEAGEKLGFLPGELDEKFEPYFRPVRDVFEERLGRGQLDGLIKSGRIEARPLAYLRGVTFKHAWVLLDEAQNMTPVQMKLFLTRLGAKAKMIINGDLKQKDISGASGLAEAIVKLTDLGSVGVVRFTRADVVRSDLCQQIVERYEG